MSFCETVLALPLGEYSTRQIADLLGVSVENSREISRISRRLSDCLHTPVQGKLLSCRLNKTSGRTWFIREYPPTRTLVIPEGIELSAFDRQQLEEAKRLLLEGTVRDRRAILIVGPPASGKTRLAAALVGLLADPPACCPPMAPDAGEKFASLLEAACGRRVLWFDGWSFPKWETHRDTVLKCFVTSSFWSYRKFHTQEMVTEAIRVRLVICTDTPLAKISPDIVRRSLVIELKGGVR